MTLYDETYGDDWRRVMAEKVCCELEPAGMLVIAWLPDGRDVAIMVPREMLSGRNGVPLREAMGMVARRYVDELRATGATL